MAALEIPAATWPRGDENRCVRPDPHAPWTPVEALCREHEALWLQTPAVLPRLGPRVGWLAQFSNCRAARKLVDSVAAELERRPREDGGRRAMRERVRSGIERFGRERLGWTDELGGLLFREDFLVASVDFVRQARAFWPSLTLAQLGQALRNVWIANWLQLLLDRPVRLRPGLFAYSMLYPLTDNLLDDDDVAPAAKRAFGERFGARLSGGAPSPANDHEAAVFELVRRIEEELPRREFPDVYARLLAIHEAQTRSLRQQRGFSLCGARLLSLTLAKGGSSVLADLHLVAPHPEPREQRFAFGYGVFLQLLDDLQDVAEDLRAGHETLFTRAAHEGTLDEPTARLACFIERVLDGQGLFAGHEFTARKDLVRHNCRALLVGSVAEHQALFSRAFARELEAHWPLSLRGCRRLRRRAARRWSRLAGGSGTDVLDSLLDPVRDPVLTCAATQAV